MSKSWVPFEWRVRYHETDQMDVVYHANYLNWFEIGRTEWIRAKGLTYLALEKQGILLPLTEAELKFKLPARYDDQITIYTKVLDYSHVRLTFASEIRRHSGSAIRCNPMDPSAVAAVAEPCGELLVSGVTRHVWVNESWKPIRIDKAAPEVYSIIQAD